MLRSLEPLFSQLQVPNEKEGWLDHGPTNDAVGEEAAASVDVREIGAARFGGENAGGSIVVGGKRDAQNAENGGHYDLQNVVCQEQARDDDSDASGKSSHGPKCKLN